jgi:hypothetical protein
VTAKVTALTAAISAFANPIDVASDAQFSPIDLLTVKDFLGIGSDAASMSSQCPSHSRGDRQYRDGYRGV